MRIAAAVLFLLGTRSVDLTVFGAGTVERVVRIGVPFERGEVAGDPAWVVVDSRGGECPTDARVLERWQDGSARWLRVEFEGAPGEHRLKRGEPPAIGAVAVSRGEDAVRLRIGGGVEAVFSRHAQDLLRLGTETGTLLGGLDLPETVLGERSVVVETEGPFRVDVRCVAEAPSGLRASVRFRVQRALPLVEFEAILANRSQRARAVDGAALRWGTGRPPRRLRWSSGEEIAVAPAQDLPLEITSGETGTCMTSGGASIAGVAGICGVESETLAFACAVNRFAETPPGTIRVDEAGDLSVRFPVTGGVLRAGEAVGLRGAVSLGALDESMAAVLLRRTRALPEARRWFLLAGPVERSGHPLLDAEEIADSLARAALPLVAAREKGARDFGDFRLFGRVWSNLEYDTALGLLLLAVREGSESLLVAAEDALFHARVVDRIHGGVEEGFAHQHAPDHSRRGRHEVGHGWIEGAIAAARLGGDPAAIEDALVFGEALLRLLDRPAPDTERTFGWPIVALAALCDAFPGRGFEEALEARTAALLAREAGEGLFVFGERWDPETGVAEVSVWLQGGLLLEALSKYAAAGGRRSVGSVADRLARRIASHALDGEANRVRGTLLYRPPRGVLLGRRGSLDPPRSLYAVAGLSRAYGLSGRRGHLVRAREWMRAIEARFPGLAEGRSANGLSLALRSLVPLRPQRSRTSPR